MRKTLMIANVTKGSHWNATRIPEPTPGATYQNESGTWKYTNDCLWIRVSDEQGV